MKTTVWKFIVKLTDFQKIEMPADAEILSFKAQNGQLCLWARVDPETETEDRSFQLVGTGHSALQASNLKFIGSAQLNAVPLVFHLFELV